MSTELDLELGPEVVELLAEFGRPVTFDVRSKTYDDETGETTLGSEPDVVAQTTPPWPYGIKFTEGSAVTEGHATIIVAGFEIAFAPTIGQACTIDGNVWRILGVTPISSGEDNAAYQLEIER